MAVGTMMMVERWRWCGTGVMAMVELYMVVAEIYGGGRSGDVVMVMVVAVVVVEC